jgi:hypothetical protein
MTPFWPRGMGPNKEQEALDWLLERTHEVQ